MSINNIIDNRSLIEDTRCDVVFEIICEEHGLFDIPREAESFTEWMPQTTVYSAIMQAMKFKPKVILHLYDEETLSGLVKDLIREQIHPKLKPDPIDFNNIPEEFWKPY